MRARSTVYFAIGLGLTCTAWVAHRRISDYEAHEKQLTARLVALEKAEPQQVERVISREIRVETAPATPAAVSSVTPESQETRPAAREFQTNEELGTAYAEDFQLEAVDRSWATKAETEYLPQVKAHLPSSSNVQSFECHSRFCALEVTHNSIQTSNQFLLDLFAMDHNGPLNQSTNGFRAGPPIRQRDGNLTYTVYIARPGVSLALDGEDTDPNAPFEKQID